MSFSSDVKEELLKHKPGARHCQIAELTAIILMTNCKVYPRLHLQTENYKVAKKLATLLFKMYGNVCEVCVKTNKSKTAHLFDVVVMDAGVSEQIRMACKLQKSFSLNRLVVQQDCCKRAFLRGAFICGGSVNNPEKSYHFEIAADDLTLVKEMQGMFARFEVETKIVERKKHYVLYIKEAEAIVDALNVIEAHKALLEMESIRTLKDVMNHTNRRVNCDLANINKALKTANKQIEDIRYIQKCNKFKDLPDSLIEIAELRLQEKDATLSQLGEMLSPPVSKSGVNHRLKKLSQIADQLRLEG